MLTNNYQKRILFNILNLLIIFQRLINKYLNLSKIKEINLNQYTDTKKILPQPLVQN